MDTIVKHICLVLAVPFILQNIRVTSFQMSISPDHVHVDRRPNTVTIMCRADAPLTACQFTWLDHEGGAGRLLRLSRGAESRPDPSHLDEGVTGYGYSGRGLGDGECGVTLRVQGFKEWMIGCRVSAGGGGWKYAWTDLTASIFNVLHVARVTPREVVALPGSNATMTVKVEGAVGECLYRHPGASDWLYFLHGVHSRDSGGRYSYHGGGLASGECGLHVTHVADRDNGPFRCSVSYLGAADHRYIPLVVLRPPSPPALTVTYEGGEMTATCSTNGSRPAAHVMWILGEEVLRSDEDDDTPADKDAPWRWPWNLTSIAQTVTRTLEPRDQGKTLKCVVGHLTLTNPMESSQEINFVQN